MNRATREMPMTIACSSSRDTCIRGTCRTEVPVPSIREGMIRIMETDVFVGVMVMMVIAWIL